MLAIDPERFADVQGSTDTEIVFHLALTNGLEEDPVAALEVTVGSSSRGGPSTGWPGSCHVRGFRRHHPLGRALRDRGTPPSLFASADTAAIHQLYPATK